MGKWLYGFLFIVVLPLALVAWARATQASVGLAAPCWLLVGCGLAAAGLLLTAEGMRLLWVRGRGLPMNAYPPSELVTTGAYSVVPHPIYVGFCLACVGASLATGSRSGLWLISPTMMLACAALVMGYEGPALRSRFGGNGSRPMIRPPAGGEGKPDRRDRLAVYLLLFLPWLLAYEGWGHVPIRGGFDEFLPGERLWPVWEWTALGYSMAYPFTLAVPFLAGSRTNLRRFFIAGWVALVAMMLCYLAVPVLSPPRPFDEHAPGGWLLALEQSDGVGGAVSFPSYDVVWSILAAGVYARNGRRWYIGPWLIAGAIAAACITTGMHSVLDVAVAVPVGLAALHWDAIWRAIIRGSERIANSWSCVRLGPVRVINYAAFAGLSAGLGMAVAGSLVGAESAWRLGVVALVSLVCAGLWGQLLVGSPTLLRPFGYFGALIGAALGLMWIAATARSGSFWASAAALAVAAPWIVLVGRFRCLVQGCCHGHQAEAGIRYRHPLSRVCRIAHLDNIPVHPTPVYSMLDNAVIGVLLARLWSVGAPCSLIGGAYLIMAGLTRFVEESTRGEPQTQVIAGLRIYQWLAVLSTVVGAIVTALPSSAAAGGIEPGWPVAWWALAIGLAYAFAMGVDFPESNRRFSRLV